MAKKSNFFWASYSDLMTSLFFIMLVLFVLTVVALKKQAIATEEELRTIKEIQSSVHELPEEYFIYQTEYKRFVLNRQIKFAHNSYDIPFVDYDYLKKVGNAINELINRLKNEDKFKNLDIKYLIVIEGMASNIGGTELTNYELSYRRALSLYLFWKEQNIIFDEIVCEVQIAGSGVYGIGRDKKDEMNQRFLIQIIPKIGQIDAN